MNIALRKSIKAAQVAVEFMLSAVVWIVFLFLAGAGMIAHGALLMFGQGPAFMVAGVFMLAACFLLKKAVTNG